MQNEEQIGVQANRDRVKTFLSGLVKDQEATIAEEEEIIELDEEQKAVEEQSKKRKNMFEDLVFYFNRETPKEILTMLTRAFGAKIVENEDDESVTHHIVDRPMDELKYGAKRSY